MELMARPKRHEDGAVDRADDPSRERLSRERVVRAAIGLADEHGLGAVTMRRLGDELAVDPMALYKHVRNKDDLVDGMVDLVVAELPPVPARVRGGWRGRLRAKAVAAREAMQRHAWMPEAVESRADATPAMLRYYDEVAAIMQDGGCSIDLVHHSLHALGSRVLGFTQELFDVAGALAAGPQVLALQAHGMADELPHLSEMLLQISHDEATIVGSGCDDDVEFAFALDLLLDGLERRRKADDRASNG
jgi:AcrR family transcriptional regulator